MAKYDPNIKTLYEKAYALMNTPVIDGNCGALCNFHCCRTRDEDGERLGMYLLPLEYPYMQEGYVTDFEIHSAEDYDLPPRIKKRYYIYCHDDNGCLRSLRPIQCRTYPFEPHLEGDELILVIESTQIHNCPLLSEHSTWKNDFIAGVYEGWATLLTIPLVKYWIQYVSEQRSIENNIMDRYHPEKGWF